MTNRKIYPTVTQPNPNNVTYKDIFYSWTFTSLVNSTCTTYKMHLHCKWQPICICLIWPPAGRVSLDHHCHNCPSIVACRKERAIVFWLLAIQTFILFLWWVCFRTQCMMLFFFPTHVACPNQWVKEKTRHWVSSFSLLFLFLLSSSWKVIGHVLRWKLMSPGVKFFKKFWEWYQLSKPKLLPLEFA